MHDCNTGYVEVPKHITADQVKQLVRFSKRTIALQGGTLIKALEIAEAVLRKREGSVVLSWVLRTFFGV